MYTLVDLSLILFASLLIDTLKACWNSSVELDSEDKGGFGGGPMHLGHTATNYASCLALALIGTPAALEAVDRHALYRFFLSRKHAPTGAFTAHDGGCVHHVHALHSRSKATSDLGIDLFSL